MVAGIPNVFANIETGRVTNNEWLDTNQSSAFEGLGLSRTQRLYGFCGCLAAGFVISLLGSILFVVGQVALFALLYSIGLLISLVATGFLVGFKTQMKLMFKPVRLVAALIFLGCIAMVFISAFVLGNDPLVIIFAVASYLAYIWYSLSYIPWARSFVKRLFGQI